MAFRPNCGRPFDQPRWADGDPLARAFIIEMKDDLAVYLTNMNAAIHGIGTSLQGNSLSTGSVGFAYGGYFGTRILSSPRAGAWVA